LTSCALLLAGCGESSAPDGDRAAAAGGGLWGTSWRAVERTRGGEQWPFEPGAAWTVGFGAAEQATMRWRGACNTAHSPVVVERERLLTAGAEVRQTTLVACDGEHAAEDRRADAFFGAGPTWALSGRSLLLASGDIALRLVPAS
jgi:hypothetical protein